MSLDVGPHGGRIQSVPPGWWLAPGSLRLAGLLAVCGVKCLPTESLRYTCSRCGAKSTSFHIFIYYSFMRVPCTYVLKIHISSFQDTKI